MNKPHKHSELIKAWADGAEIECYCRSVDKWHYHANPMWIPSLEYRVKPRPKPKREPRYRLITAYGDGMRKVVTVPKVVCDYYTIQQFVEELETDWDSQHYEVFKDFNESYKVIVCDTYPSLGTIRMSEQCAEKLCEMLNNGEVEL